MTAGPRAVFMGTPTIAVPCLEALLDDGAAEVPLVVSPPDRPAGRGRSPRRPAVASRALARGVPVHQTADANRDPALLDRLAAIKPDLIVVFAFAQFLSGRLLALPSLGCFNVHASLLPRHRGASPIAHAILAGDRSTGVSVQRMVRRMDAGDVGLAREVPIGPGETAGSLADKVAAAAPAALLEFLRGLADGSLSFTAQDESLATRAPALRKEDGLLDFRALSPAQVDRRVRAFDPWPGTHTLLAGKRLKILRTAPASAPAPPGRMVASVEDGVVIGCRGGSVRALEVQLEGRRRCRDTDFANGLAARDREADLG